MAIQVNGTQVIGNSRELTNIASIDATTTAAINAAGVGGANVSYTADGSITKGRFVNITDTSKAQHGTASDQTNIFQTSAQMGTGSSAPGLYYTGGRGCAKYFRDQNVLAHVGRISSNGTGQVAVQLFVKNANNTLTAKPIVQVGRNVSQGWAGIADIVTDGAGNWAMLYACYNGGSHQWTINTFSTDSSYNISNMGTPSSLSTGDLYIFDGHLVSYDVNRFCLIRNSTNGMRQLYYHTFYRQGTSPAFLANGTLGDSVSAQNGTSVVGLFGHLEPMVSTNKAVMTVFSNGSNTWTGGSQGLAAATLTFGSNHIPVVSSVSARVPVGSYSTVSWLTQNTYELSAFGMSKDGLFLGGSDGSGAGQEVYPFRKASASSDAITVVSTSRLVNYNRSALLNTNNNTFLKYDSSTNALNTYNAATGDYISATFINGLGAGAFAMDTVTNTFSLAAMDDAGFLTWKDSFGSFKYQFTNIPTVTGAFGIAKQTVSSGSSVGVAVVGQVVDGYSNLTVGKGYTAGDSLGTPQETLSSALAVAISSTEMLVSTGSAG
jgi:hypothetical protein